MGGAIIMKTNYKRIAAIILAAILLMSVFSACSKKDKQPEEESTTTASTTQTVNEETTAQEATEPEEETTANAEDNSSNTTRASIAQTTAKQTTSTTKKQTTTKAETTTKKPQYTEAKNFRIVSYLVANQSLNNYANIDRSHLAQQTDIIVFGIAGFSEDGSVWTDNDFSLRLNNIKKAIKASGSKARIHINLLGPGSQSSSDVWEDQMVDQATRHSNAFASGKLEQNILNLLKKHKFDGVFFDYEYPLKKQYWNDFDDFLIRLDKKLGNKYIIGAAISPWNTKQSPDGMDVLDMIEVMAYDTWDDDGNHATVSQAKRDILRMMMLGYDVKKLDLGIPFYGRPTNHGAYWYGYNGDVDRIDENGLCYDKATGLTFSYNTPSMVYEKTNWAIKRNLGGVMIWHYSCDAPASNKKSLFNAIETAKKGKPLA